ncbi:MAG: circadian clock protein KaiC [Patescibacteria group bacterium]|nr:circadian clock protein KaiC [Patescibacteria group bacterium]
MAGPKCDMKKVRTGIVGFDELAEGGLPHGRTVLVSGPAGSGKTLFGLEFLLRGVSEFDAPGVFVTFEERKSDIFNEVACFGWDLAAMEKEGKIAFVDASSIADSQVEIGEYDFGALMARIRHAVDKVGAKRVVIDSVSALFLRYKDNAIIRREMFKMIDVLRNCDVTSIITAERVRDEDAHSRFGVEDFVADGVVFLYNTIVGRDRERQIEIVKLRGASHQTGRHHFLIGDTGLVIFPVEKQKLTETVYEERISSGVSGVDTMTGGGIFRGSTTLLLGSSGTGRTVLGLHFLQDGTKHDEKGLFISFEEGQSQVFATAKSLGWDFEGHEKKGLLKIESWNPEGMPIEFYLKAIREIVNDWAPKRVVIDSVTPLVSHIDEQRFRRFISSLNAHLKEAGVTTVINYTTGASLQSVIAAESDLAVLADNIIVMRFGEAELGKEREIIIAKTRASAHDELVRKYLIDKDGITVLGIEGEVSEVFKGHKKDKPGKDER